MNRIDYLDNIKGVFIILMVMGHCDCYIAHNIPGLEITIMPLFFAVSGIFYKNYGGIKSLAINKINRILVPFFIYYFMAYIMFYAIMFLAPQYLITEAKGITDMFTQKMSFNVPIWYLFALFWAFMIYALLEKGYDLALGKIASLDKYRKLIVALPIIAIAVVGKNLGNNETFLPLHFDTAMTSMPFFYLGVLLKGSAVVNKGTKLDRYNIPLCIALYAISLVLTQTFEVRLVLSNNIIENYMAYIIAMASILAVIFLFKSLNLKNIPVLSYLGRNTLLIVGIHQIIYRPLGVALGMQPIGALDNPYVLTLLTLVICAAAQPIFSKYLPYAVGEKDLFASKKN